MEKTSNQKRIEIEEIGLYLRTIQMDYSPKNNKEMAELISKHFNVICEEEDVDNYHVLYEHHEELNKRDEDYELESRREAYFQSIGQSNPFI
jgi:hypothetical protein